MNVLELFNKALTGMPLSRGLLGVGDTAAAIGSGILAQPISGLAGILAMPGGPEKAANAVSTVQNRLTYQPRTDTARNALTALGTIAEPLNKLKEYTGDAGYAMGGPVGGMLGATLPDAAMMFAPALRKPTPQAFPLPMQGEAGAIVYHGSPHKFDRFDSSKIGTGEGAQAYGHGMYFADNPAVARDYAWNLSQNRPDRVKYQGNAVTPDTVYSRSLEDVGLLGKDAALQKIDDNIRFNSKYAPDMADTYRTVRKKIEDIDAKDVVVNKGSFYKVDLPDEAIAKMLDWDSPITKQKQILDAFPDLIGQMTKPELLSQGHPIYASTKAEKLAKQLANELGSIEAAKAKALELKAAAKDYREMMTPNSAAGILDLWQKRGAKIASRNPNTITGQEIYDALHKSANYDPAATAEVMRNAGIPGVKYLDGMSRDGGTGTSNYVVFPGNENLLKILERQ